MLNFTLEHVFSFFLWADWVYAQNKICIYNRHLTLKLPLASTRNMCHKFRALLCPKCPHEDVDITLEHFFRSLLWADWVYIWNKITGFF
jgi:hypothetical protein